jgi:hypothetical protein
MSTPVAAPSPACNASGSAPLPKDDGVEVSIEWHAVVIIGSAGLTGPALLVMLVHLQAQAHPSVDTSRQLAIVPYRPSAMPSAARHPEAHQGTAQEAKTTLVPRLVSVSSRTAEAWRVSDHSL